MGAVGAQPLPPDQPQAVLWAQHSHTIALRIGDPWDLSRSSFSPSSAPLQPLSSVLCQIEIKGPLEASPGAGPSYILPLGIVYLSQAATPWDRATWGGKGLEAAS